jgi:hypothetical protein
VALCLVGLAGVPARAQEFSLPFRIGELLEYRVSVQRLGNVGHGRMWIEGPVTLDDRVTWVLRFDMEAGRGPIRARDRTSSWLDPRTMSITRFEKEERHPLSRSREMVRVLADSGLWRDDEGPHGTLGSDQPLDELSFMYFLRTLPLERDTVLELDRHFDSDRNPIIVRIAGTDTIETPAGVFRTRVVEMEVRDPKRYKGTGRIRIHLDEADCHVPVRIESRMPLLGTTTLTLTGRSHPPRYPGAVVC